MTLILPAMPTGTPLDPRQTRPSIFLAIQTTQTTRKELAWEEFHARYAPILAGFARHLGARPQDIDDIVQEVMLGFYKVSPDYQYDPKKGRFRAYLKVCTVHALQNRVKKRSPATGVDLDQLMIAQADEQWDAEWEKHIFRQAAEEARRDYANNKTYQAFERYAILGEEPAAVAEKLNMSIDSVYTAKKRVMDAVKLKVDALREEYGW